MKCETNAFHRMLTDNYFEVNTSVNCQGGVRRGVVGVFVIALFSVIMYFHYKDPGEGDILNCRKYDTT